MPALFARRGVLQVGALTSGLAMTGMHAASAATPAPVRPQPITGSIVAHLRLDPMRGGTIRLAERNPAGGITRDLAYLDVPVGSLYRAGKPTAGEAPLRVLCARAQDLAVRVTAADWQVSPGSCRLSGTRIIHSATGQSRHYTAWVDMV